jgi:hypothetical protein
MIVINNYDKIIINILILLKGHNMVAHLSELAIHNLPLYEIITNGVSPTLLFNIRDKFFLSYLPSIHRITQEEAQQAVKRFYEDITNKINTFPDRNLQKPLIDPLHTVTYAQLHAAHNWVKNVNLINFAEKLSEQIPALQIIVNNPALNITLKAEAIKQFFDDPQNNPTLQDITHLDLGYRDLSELPAEIGNLVNLQGLYLSDNQITQLPPEIGNLVNLRWLNLFNNQITHFPPEIGNLVNLQTLNLSHNQITHLPPEIGNLVNLQRLDLSNNQITHFPPEIGNLVNLRWLDLSHNQITQLPPEIGNLVNLRELDLSRNPLNYQKEFYFHPDPLIRSKYRGVFPRDYNIRLIATILLITGVSMMSMFYFNRIRGTQQT